MLWANGPCAAAGTPPSGAGFLCALALLSVLSTVALLPGARARSFGAWEGRADGEPDVDVDLPLGEDPLGVDAEDVEQLQKRILAELGFTSPPDANKMNVSHGEFERAHRQYVRAVQSSERAAAEAGQRPRPPDAPRFFAFEHHGPIAEAAEAAEGEGGGVALRLAFAPRVAGGRHGRVRVETALVRLLVPGAAPEAGPGPHKVQMALYAEGPAGRRLLERRPFEVGTAPKYTELEATEAVASLLTGQGPIVEGLRLEFDAAGARAGVLAQPRRLAPLLTVVARVRKGGAAGGRVKRGAGGGHRGGGGGGGARDPMSVAYGGRAPCREDGPRCCRHEMNVIFSEIRYNWIKQPKSFDAGFCKGRCPPRYNPAHPHALMQALTSKVRGNRQFPRPCCAPSKLGPLEILYPDPADPSRLLFFKWENTTVLECACS